MGQTENSDRIRNYKGNEIIVNMVNGPPTAESTEVIQMSQSGSWFKSSAKTWIPLEGEQIPHYANFMGPNKI